VDAYLRLPPDVPDPETRYTHDELKGHGMMTIRILLVDDSAQVRQDLRSMLALWEGIDVAGEAANGQEGVALEEALSPDVVLMDLAMPVMDGFEAARRIKARRPGCRIVALTVHAGEEDRRLALLAGVDAFVVKGAPVATLMQCLRGGPSTDETPTGGAT
jgi:two-component system response regulator DesR